MKCFYHNDMDGKAAAWVVRHALATGSVPYHSEATYVASDYGTPFPLDTIVERESVWIVDFSIEPDQMLALLDRTRRVVWIDHHKTAIEKYADFSETVDGLREDGVAGCALTWRYCFPGDTAPRMIELVADRDVWTWRYGNETANFHAGAAMCDTSPESSFWDTMYSDSHQFVRVLDAGATVNGYKAQFYADMLKHIGFEGMIDGHRCLCMNAAHIGSEAFGTTAMDDYSVLSPFYFDGQQFTVSLYSKSVDVSKIAKARGGGGHRGAAGFQCAQLPYDALA